MGKFNRESDSEENFSEDQFDDKQDQFISEEEDNSDVLEMENQQGINDEDLDESYDNLQNFGKNKQSYYMEDDETSGDSSEEEELQKEAEKVYKQKQQELAEDDFDLGDGVEYKNELLDEKESQENESQENQQKISKNQELDEEEKLEKQNKDKQEIQLLFKEIQKCQEGIQDSELFLQNKEILEQKEIQELFSKDFPLIKQEQYQAYLICLLFYFLVKQSGQSVKTHPVIKYLSNFKEQVAIVQEIDEEFQVKIGQVMQKMTLNLAKKNNDKNKSNKNKNIKNNQVKNNKQQAKNNQILNLSSNSQSKLNANSKNYIQSYLDEEDEEDQRIKKSNQNKNSENKAQNKKKIQFDDDEEEEENFKDLDLDAGFDSDSVDYSKIKLDPISPQKKIQKPKNKTKNNNNNNKSAEDEYYEKIQTQRIQKKLQKEQQKKLKKQEAEAVQEKLFTLKEVGENKPRRINMQILQNKGLLRTRNHDISRVKLRKKYKTAQQKLVSMGNKSGIKKEKQRDYAGETGFIKSNVIKGTKI